MVHTRWNISVPESLKAQVEADAKKQGLVPSKLIVAYIAEHYAATDAEEQLEALQHKLSEAEHQADVEVNTLKRELQELESSKKQTKILEKESIEQHNKIELLERDLGAALGTIEVLEHSTQELRTKLTAEGETYQRALAERERSYKDVLTEEERRHTHIANALRHEQELTQLKLEAMQREVQREQELNRELRTDKEQLQKQLELVTLRLPAPKKSFWSRVLGRKKQ